MGSSRYRLAVIGLWALVLMKHPLAEAGVLWLADRYFEGGGVASTDAAVARAGIPAAAPLPVYQSFRYGLGFAYVIPDLVPDGRYTVRLHFSEPYFASVGKRKFNVAIGGTQVLTNFDIIAAAGGRNIATVQAFAAQADSDGKIKIIFYGPVFQPIVNGIEVLQQAQPVVAISCGGSGSFSSSYLLDVWQTDQGLPDDNVNVIVQTRDGFLWVGTGGGLARFDGLQFNVFDALNTPELKSGRVLTLFEDREGRLWIGTEGGLTCYETNHFLPCLLEKAAVTGIRQDRQGALWIGASTGMHRWERGQLRAYPIREGLPSNRVTAVEIDRRGQVWAGTAEGLWLLDGQGFRPFELEYGSVSHLFPARNEEALYVVLGDERVMKLRDGQLSPGPKFSESDRGEMPGIGGVGNGDFHLGPDRMNVVRRGGEKPEYVSVINGNPGRVHVTCLCRDREGGLWLGTNGQGLKRIKTRLFEVYGMREGLPESSALSVYEDRDAAVWVGSSGGEVSCLRGTSVSVYGLDQGLPNGAITSMGQDERGRFWVGTDGFGLFGFERNRFLPHPVPRGLVAASITVMCADRRGALWIGTRDRGLFRLLKGELSNYGQLIGLTNSPVRAIAQDAEGSLWVGTSGGGIHHLEGRRHRQYRSRDGLAHDHVSSICAGDDGIVWIGTYGGGLSRYRNGRFTNYTTKQGLLDDVIFQVIDDRRGHLWMTSDKGVFQVSMSSFADLESGQPAWLACTSYGKGDGLANAHCSGGSQPAGCMTADGKLWFPTRAGVAVLKLGALREETQSTPVFLEQVSIDGEDFSHPGSLRAGPGKRRFAFHYTGINLSAPEQVRYRYRLRGLDRYWVEAGSRRSALYQDIPPGGYVFEVVASNKNGTWNEQGAFLQVAVLPFFWQTAWFRLSAGLLAAGASGGAILLTFHRRTRRRFRSLESQLALHQERLRISRDIHDDVGGRLTEVLLLAAMVERLRISPEQVETHVKAMSQAVREIIRSLDAIVWAVNPRNDSLDNLTAYILQYAQKQLGMTSMRCLLEAPDEMPPWRVNSQVRHGLFLIVREALNNVIKHSEASKVWVRVGFERPTLLITIEDNGKGFVPGINGHRNGLQNMEKRMRDLGGVFGVVSRPGHGTEIHLRMRIEEHSERLRTGGRSTGFRTPWT